MKTAILALMGVLIGGGVGTGGGAVLLARCADDPVVAGAEDHAPADTTAPAAPDEHAVEGPDTVGALGPLPDLTGSDDSSPPPDAEADPPAVPPAPDAVDGVVPQTDDELPLGAVDPAAPAVEPIVLAPTPDPTALRRLARIFSNMKADQAAAVMIELTDAEAERILVSMPERAAAAILGKMDSTRAAVLSRRVLGGGGS